MPKRTCCVVAGVTAAALWCLSCEDPAEGLVAEPSPIAGVWVAQDSAGIHTLTLRDFGFDFLSHPVGGDTVRALEGTYEADSSVTPCEIDFVVSYDYPTGNIVATPMYAIYELIGDTMRIAIPNDVGWLERPQDFLPYDYYKTYNLVKQPD